MQPGVIEGTTRMLGKKNGQFVGLAVLDQDHPCGSHTMASAWYPTPAELERLAAGAPIYLLVLGYEHPPVNMLVPPAPDITNES